MGMRKMNGEHMGSETKGKLDEDIDALFRLPLAEFIGARKTLVARLKKDGRAKEADRVKALAKPSISAWTANQLYWKHREAFDRLIAKGQRFRQAQTSRAAGKLADMREALDARRETLSHLSDLATTLLCDAGHNPTLDTIRRITTTLEALSAYALLPDGPSPGRLTKDVDPPGFDSLASFIPGAGATESTEKPALASFIPGAGTKMRTGEPARVSPSKKSGSAAAKTRQKATPAREVSRLQETRQAKIAAAKVSLQDARKSLADARTRAQSLGAAQKKADAEAKQAEKQSREAEKQRREAEERFKKTTAASEDATRRARSVTVEVEAVTKALEDARRTVEKASKELESLFRESP
jgi:hypothetical protein